MDKDRSTDTRRSVQELRAVQARRGDLGVPNGEGQSLCARHPALAAHPAGRAHGQDSAHAVGQVLARNVAPALARKVGHEVAQTVAPAAGREVVRELRENIKENVQDSVQGALLDVFEAVLPRIADLVGEGFERKSFRDEMTRYLAEQGVPQQAVAAMSRAYELELATKAMLFDKMQAARAHADAKLDGIPAVHAPRRASLPEADGKRRARAALKKNPNSTEALAALFAEM